MRHEYDSWLWLLVTITVLLGAILSCTDNDDIEPKDKHDVDIGVFELLDESVAMMPYKNATGVIFRDSIGNEITFSVSAHGVNTAHGKLHHYDVFEAGDTVTYSYRSEYLIVHLQNDSLDLTLSVWLQARPYHSEPSNDIIADVVSIHLRSAVNPSLFHTVFYHVLEQRTWPQVIVTAENLGSLMFFGKEFDDVLFAPFTLHSTVYFNYDVGIISFTDHDEKQWRFERFQ